MNTTANNPSPFTHFQTTSFTRRSSESLFQQLRTLC
nr:MAG TPA: hypothetical protein [Caudoviricetes sp.]